MNATTRNALAAMQAANARLTPEQRSERSKRAAATAARNRAATAAALAAAQQAAVAAPAQAVSTVAAVAPQQAPAKPKPAPTGKLRTWRVSLVLEHEGRRGLRTVECTAMGMKRAASTAREMHRASKQPGAVVAIASVVDKDLAGLGVFVA